jgi:archaellum component FlaC
MNDQEMKEFLAGAQVGIEAGIENLKEQIRSTSEIRDQVNAHIEELVEASTLEKLKLVLARQAAMRRDALNDCVKQFEDQLAKLKDTLRTSQEALKG